MLPTSTTIYTQMSLAMNAQPHAPAMRFTQRLHGRGISLRIVGDRFGNTAPYLSVSRDRANARFTVEEDDRYGIERTTDESTHAVYPNQRIFWSATWPMIHTLGLQPPEPTTPRPRPSLAPLADDVALTDPAYAMRTAGEATVDGARCYHLVLHARGNKEAHPLTDLYVDEKSKLLRRAVMAFRTEEIVAGSSGTIALDFGRVGAYWLVTHGRIDARAHSLLMHAGGAATFVNSAFRFRSTY